MRASAYRLPHHEHIVGVRADPSIQPTVTLGSMAMVTMVKGVNSKAPRSQYVLRGP